MILYLTSKANVNLLDSVEFEQDLTLKKLIGRFSLYSFVVKDMRHFSHVRFIVVDRKAVMESDDEVIQALQTFQTMYDIRIIIIAEGLAKDSTFLHQLIQTNVTDIVTAIKFNDIYDELKTCFSKQGMQRYITAAFFSQIAKTEPEPLSNEEKYIFTCKNVRIAIAGSDRRTGVTTTAMNLVYWINAHGGSACYLEANTSNHLAHVIQLFDPVKSGNAYVLENVDFYITPELNQDYNFIVIDCGVLNHSQLQDTFANADIRLLCGAAMPYELPAFYRAAERCKELPHHVLVLFVPDNLKPYVCNIINNNIIFGGHSHDLFDSTANGQIYSQLIKPFIKHI